MKVIVSCSTKFHAFALAEQLQRFGVLDTFYTSYAYQKNKRLRRLAKRIDKENIDKKHIRTFSLLSIPIKLFPKLAFFWNSLFDRWVAYQIKRSNADIFIGWSGMSLHALRAAKQKGMITILERGSSHISYQRKLLTEEFQKYNIPTPTNPKVENKELIEYNEVDYISIPSSFVKDSFTKMGVNPDKLIQNPYGTSSHFKRVEPPAESNTFRILYLGSLMIRKGLPYLFEALHKLTIPKNSYEVLFVGNVQDDIKPLAEQSKQDNWQFLGHMDHYSLSQIISSCDVAVHPSLEEGLSMVIPQIMSCGVPVIATTNTGGMDIIEDGKTGIIVPIRDAEAIAKAIEDLYNDVSRLNSMKHTLSNQNFDLTWDNYGTRYADSLSKMRTSQA